MVCGVGPRFHMIPLAMIDPGCQALSSAVTKEWYVHPSGQIPACEWALGDVNPPVHGWATWRICKIDQKLQGKR